MTKKKHTYYPPESDEHYRDAYKMKKLIIEKGKAFKISKRSKYLLIMPDDANIATLAPAIAKFFDPTPVFVLVAKDITQIRLAELVEETENGKD